MASVAKYVLRHHPGLDELAGETVHHGTRRLGRELVQRSVRRFAQIMRFRA